jgi:hypothetical protein
MPQIAVWDELSQKTEVGLLKTCANEEKDVLVPELGHHVYLVQESSQDVVIHVDVFPQALHSNIDAAPSSLVNDSKTARSNLRAKMDFTPVNGPVKLLARDGGCRGY